MKNEARNACSAGYKVAIVPKKLLRNDGKSCRLVMGPLIDSNYKPSAKSELSYYKLVAEDASNVSQMLELQKWKTKHSSWLFVLPTSSKSPSTNRNNRNSLNNDHLDSGKFSV